MTGRELIDLIHEKGLWDKEVQGIVIKADGTLVFASLDEKNAKDIDKAIKTLFGAK